ncbi:MAG TPA: toprim domain-containing protein [Dyadobacter sp.]|jgi:5S rRNA maturation endonuclease (ribonuclease M5)|nr:toprim domain-containing protein [Dyadobacter sp.]
MNIKQLNQMPITEYLDSVGIAASYKKGENYWYISPIRESERSPSFKVNTTLNRWYDYSLQQGGKLFDLAQRLNPALDLNTLVRTLSDVFLFAQQNPVAHILAKPIYHSVHSGTSTSPAIIINNVRPLGGNSAITEYLENRGIDIEIAAPFCEEVYYEIGDRNYFAIGFENQSGGYELRSRFFKGSSSPKDITHFQNGNQSVCVLEGFMDFLSLLTLRKQSPIRSDFLILNSVSFVDRSIEMLRNYRDVFLYLDHDSAGRKAQTTYQEADLNIIDASGSYHQFKDLNEYLLDKQSTQLEEKQSRHLKRSRGLSL